MYMIKCVEKDLGQNDGNSTKILLGMRSYAIMLKLLLLMIYIGK